MTSTKKPWQSKTMLLNAIIGLAMAASLFVPAASGVKSFIEANAAGIGMVWSVLSMVLRTITKDQIKLEE